MYTSPVIAGDVSELIEEIDRVLSHAHIHHAYLSEIVTLFFRARAHGEARKINVRVLLWHILICKLRESGIPLFTLERFIPPELYGLSPATTETLDVVLMRIMDGISDVNFSTAARNVHSEWWMYRVNLLSNEEFIFNRKFVFSITRTAGKMYAQKLERQGIAAKTFFANFYRQKLLPKTFLKQRRHRRSTKHAP